MKGQRRKVRQKKSWEDNVKDWTGIDFASSTRATETKAMWKEIAVKAYVVPQRLCKVIGSARLD